MFHNALRFSLTVAAVLTLGGQRCRAETPEEAETIGRNLGGIDKASTFLKLLKGTDGAKNLLFSTSGTTTVFVPTNLAFEKLPKDLYTTGRYQQATEYYARRNYQLKGRYSENILRFYQINPLGILNNDILRNQDYDFASTAWVQRNKFLELLRQLETKQPLLIDELELRSPARKP